MASKRTIAAALATVILFIIILAIATSSLKTNPSSQNSPKNEATTSPNRRENTIPLNAQKISPQTDLYPPILHSDEWTEPVPLSATINTAGGEDSPFITPDGNILYFFFTPNVTVPAEKQLFDGTTGIYNSKKENGEWKTAQRIVLESQGKLALDGAEFVQEDIMWFASAREGYSGINLFTAELKNGKWTNWQYAGDTLNKEYQAGEMCLTPDGTQMYFHSARGGGKGGLDIWTTKKVSGDWQQPENVGGVNTQGDDFLPFITPDGNELWFTRTYMGAPAIYRSTKMNGSWSEPQLIISQFAAEPALDNSRNLYFAHHFYDDRGQMVEADIYVAYRK